MELRIQELGAIDPLSVPLPNGTEVTTRVDRVIAADRRVPQGAVGPHVADVAGAREDEAEPETEERVRQVVTDEEGLSIRRGPGAPPPQAPPSAFSSSKAKGEQEGGADLVHAEGG